MKKLLGIFGKPKAKYTTCLLDTCTLCQLNCRGCYMRNFDNVGRGQGYISHKNFVKFLELNPEIQSIEIAAAGEVFLNPDLVEILRTSYQRRVVISTSTGANFNNVTDEQIDALVRYKVNTLTVSLDGTSQETYSWYRRNGNFDTVIANIQRLNAKKKELCSEFPSLVWQYIIFPNNCSITEIRKAKEMAKSLGMGIRFAKDWEGFIPENRNEIEMETGISWLDSKPHTDYKKDFVLCSYLWIIPLINWDGRFFGCCYNLSNGDFNKNMFKIPLNKLMNSRLIVKTKRMLCGKGECKHSPCAKCPFYQKLRESGNFLNEKDVLEVPWK